MFAFFSVTPIFSSYSFSHLRCHVNHILSWMSYEFIIKFTVLANKKHFFFISKYKQSKTCAQTFSYRTFSETEKKKSLFKNISSIFFYLRLKSIRSKMDLRNHLFDGKMQILMSYMCVCFEDGYFFFFF